MTGLLLLRAADATEDILREVFGIRITKKKGDPLDADGFMSFVRGLAHDLKRATRNAEAQGLAEALRTLEVDWPKMTPKQREQTVRAAEKAIGGIATQVSPAIKQKLLDDGQKIVEATKRASAGKFDLSIDTALALGDERMVQSMAGMQSLYVTDEYGRRGAALSHTARVIAGSGLARGLDQYAIGEELRLAVGTQMAGRSDAYWDVLASIFVARTRTWGQLSSFDEAGIDAWRFVAVLDEVTSEVCRFMDGKVFSVRGAMSRYQQVAASEDPEQVKVLQPFLQIGRDDQGGQYIYYRRGEHRVPVAQIDQAGMGQRDAVGAYSRAMSDKKLEAAGVGPPPLHGHCRSEIVPESLGTSVQVPRGPAVLPPAPVSVPRPKPPAVPVTVLPPAPTDVVTVRPADQVVPGSPVRPPPIEPPHVGGLKTGVHVKSVVGTGISAGRVADVFAAISDDRLLAYLQQNPVETIVFDPDRKGSGVYKYSTKQLTLKAKREKDSYGKKLKPGESFSMSKTAKTELEAIQVTLIHELGHHVQNRGSNPTIDAIVEKAFAESPGAITKYGNTEPLEYFAESFAAFYRKPQTLKAHDPVGYKMVLDVLRERGIRDAKRPRAVPVVTPALPPRDSSANILATKIGEATGSNKGGVYRGADGVERYVKFYDDPAQAHCEHLANIVYADLGHAAPKSLVFEHEGRWAYASEILPGAKTLAEAGLTKSRAADVMGGFVADVLTANWDAVGTGLDNAVVLPDGSIVRIDNGGTFLMRAKEGRKAETVLEAITEWRNFFDRSINPYYAQVAKKAGVATPRDMTDLVKGEIQKVLALEQQAGSWDAYVARVIPRAQAEDRRRIVAMLDARTALLQLRLSELSRAARIPEKPKEIVFSADSDVGKRVFAKLEDLVSRTQAIQFVDNLYSQAGVDASHLKHARRTISRWTSGFSKDEAHKEVYRAAQSLIGGAPGADGDPQEAALRRAYETRKERWRLFLQAIGEKDPTPPTHLVSYRGVQGKEFVTDVARAWMNGDTHINLRSYETASWSLRRTNRVEEFAGVEFDGEKVRAESEAGVIHTWKIPMEETMLDQVVDDASFMGIYFDEHEVVAGKGHDKGVNVEATSPEVLFDRKRYTYAEREELIAELRRQNLL